MMEPMVVFPERESPKAPPPERVASDQSFYAATMYGTNPQQDYKDSKLAFDTTGESDLVTRAQEAWKTEQDQSAKDAIAGIIADPAVDKETKQAVLSSYVMGGYVSPNLREKYKQTLAAKDIATSNADRAAQDAWIDAMQQRDVAAHATQEEINKFGTTLDDSTGLAFAGIIRDMLPGVAASWNVAVAKTARETGVDVSLWDTIKSAIFTGSANAAIKKEYDTLPVERQKEFVQKVVESYKNSPGFDFNKWIDFQSQIENPAMPWWGTSLENVASVFNIVGLGWVLRSPTKALSYATTIRPRVNPVSPAGTTATANIQAAQKIGATSVADTTGDFAKAMGTTRAELVSDWYLPKLEEVDQVYPDIAKDLEMLDKHMSGVYKETKFDPNIIPITQREADEALVYKVTQEANGPVYQQANSVLEQEARVFKGTATFGRNDSFGFSTVEEANAAYDKVQEAIKNVSGGSEGNVRVEQKGNQYFVKWDFQRDYDPYSHLVFGQESVSAKFKIPLWGDREIGFSADSLARSIWGKHLFPSTMRMDPWVPKSAALADLQAGKVEHDFIREIRSNVTSIKHKEELYNAIRSSEQTGKWMKPNELSAMFPNLSSVGQEELARAYYYTRRMSEYNYNWANRYDKALKSEKGHQAIYVGGDLVSYGTTKFDASALTDVKHVWDFGKNKVVSIPSKLEGRVLVRLESPKTVGDDVYTFGLVGEKSELGILPPNTLPKIDVYFPRKNKENWYIKKTPKKLKIDGIEVSATSKNGAARLRNHQTTIGAGATNKDAQILANKFRAEFPHHDIEVRRERGDTADAILTDYKVFKASFEYGKKRGDRLPTVDGFATIEDPIIALIESTKRIVRLDAWKDYSDAFRTNWVKAFGKFTRDGEFPATLNDFRQLEGATEEEIKQFNSAQRLFEQWVNQAYKTTTGDSVWKNLFFWVGDIFEKLPVPGLHQLAKDIGQKGNLLVKAPKQFGTTMYMYLNPVRQWFIQPQQLLEMAFLDKDIAKTVAFQTAPITGALISEARSLTQQSTVLKTTLQKVSGLSPTEFNATLDAIYKSGIVQSVDMNMVLHGMFNDVERALVESTGKQFYEGAKNVVKSPIAVGKGIGYTPAELTNQVGIWLASKERWIKQNPHLNWNTPENIKKITGDAWDIAHSMTTRAGAFPYQDGALSLLFQFAAVSHKSFLQIFSSKTLTVEERTRLAASRVALYGMWGVPGSFAIDAWFQKYAEEGTKTEWNKWKRGMTDWVVNNMINSMMSEGDVKTDVAIAESLSPLPKTLPYLDLVAELSKFGKDGAGNPRLPFTAAMGSVFEAAGDISSIYRSKALDTEQAAERAGRLTLQLASGYNNWAKAMMIKNFGDITDKLGNPKGLNLTRAEMMFQFFGVNSEKVLAQYQAQNFKQERESFIKQHSQEIHRQLMGMRTQFGKEGFSEYVNQLNSLASLVDEDLRDEIKLEVLRLDKQSLLTKNESLLLYIVEHHKEKNDRYMSSMIGALTSTENPQAQRNIEALKKEGIIK